ncbi:hypothetical protein [Nocardia terpenica]|uniref:Uncharacterized protein n=1 Tax=Nocardia terpenica TaxID=455432 RepID=A0A6G9ZA48_9NOCA|nr:hypothetical protein [Nocardia terpenica]QIS22237.1 hypothetical protein F6W96_31735 [Nocardia terpenica]
MAAAAEAAVGRDPRYSGRVEAVRVAACGGPEFSDVGIGKWWKIFEASAVVFAGNPYEDAKRIVFSEGEAGPEGSADAGRFSLKKLCGDEKIRRDWVAVVKVLELKDVGGLMAGCGGEGDLEHFYVRKLEIEEAVLRAEKKLAGAAGTGVVAADSSCVPDSV